VALPASGNPPASPETSQQQEQYNQQHNQQSQVNINLYTPTRLSTSLEVAKDIAASYVLEALTAENASGNSNVDGDNETEYVSSDVTSSVAAMSIANSTINGYTPLYNGGMSQDHYSGLHVYSGVGYVSAANEAYAQY